MKQFGWISLLLLLLVAGCSRKNKHVISIGKMEDVFYDLYLAESSMNNASNIRREPQSDYLQAVLHKHDVTKEQYDSSLVWYTQHADEYLTIYQKTLARLERREQIVTKEVERYQESFLSEKGDSIQLIKGRAVILSPALGKGSWTTRLNSDKNYPKFKKIRFVYSVPYKADTAQMVVKLSVWNSNGKSEIKSDTLTTGCGMRRLEVYADSLMNYVEVNVGFVWNNAKSYRVILDKIALERIKIDSIPLLKNDTILPADSLKLALSADSAKAVTVEDSAEVPKERNRLLPPHTRNRRNIENSP